jgi:hypothetical protein
VRIFSAQEAELLRKIVENWRPDLIPLLDRSTVTDDEREDLRGALAEELVIRGLSRPDWEPNEYGLRIENLIDKIGRIPTRK